MRKIHRLEGHTTAQVLFILKTIREPEVVEIKIKVRQRQVQPWIFYKEILHRNNIVEKMFKVIPLIFKLS